MKEPKKELSRIKCRPCEGKTTLLTEAQIAEYLESLEGWELSKEPVQLYREFKTKDFITAVSLINKIAQTAQEQGHHPDIHLTNYRYLRVELSTHAIGGLSENDFIIAAKINELAGAGSQ